MHSRFTALLVSLMMREVTWSSPVKNSEQAERYLDSYHYNMGMSEADDNRVSNLIHRDKQTAKLQLKIKHFQQSWHLRPTGVLDNDTVSLMSKDRCGMPDLFDYGDGYMTRKRRFALQGSRWYKNELTYRISAYPNNGGNAASYSGLRRSDVDRIVHDAFTVWSDVTPLVFRKSSAYNVDIEIKFATLYHGDPYPFDGFKGILAHAFFPDYGGDVHFDGHEAWTDKSAYGTNLFQVTAHEVGHALGLKHSFDRDALMAPFYSGYTRDFRLHSDDVTGIQSIYGASSKNKQPPPVNPQPPKQPAGDGLPRCEDIEFDDITSHMESGRVNTYAFFGEQYARLDLQGMVAGYPRPIAADWAGLPSNIDAALYWGPQHEERRQIDWTTLTYKNVLVEVSPARTFFFKGDMYWRYENKRLQTGYPRKISDWFRGVPNDIDTAFVWSGNGVTYFIKDKQYYRYRRGSGVDWGYPRPLTTWRSLPATVSSAFTWNQNNKTYFFSGQLYYGFDNKAFKVGSVYPRSVSKWWLGCQTQSLRHTTQSQIVTSSHVTDTAAISVITPRTLAFFYVFFYISLFLLL